MSSSEVESMKISVGPVDMPGTLLLLALSTLGRLGVGEPRGLEFSSPSWTRYLAKSAAVGGVCAGWGYGQQIHDGRSCPEKAG